MGQRNPRGLAISALLSRMSVVWCREYESQRIFYHDTSCRRLTQLHPSVATSALQTNCKSAVLLDTTGALQPGQTGRPSPPRRAGMAGGGSHLWADEVEEEDAAKGIPPPEKFTPAPEWRGSAGRPAEPRAFGHQHGPDAPVSPTSVRRRKTARLTSMPGRQATCLNPLSLLAASVRCLPAVGSAWASRQNTCRLPTS